MTAVSRRLRRDAPFPERLLWSRLRSGRLAGMKFRRQHPIEPYIADFYCHAVRLVVELDGDSHLGQRREDDERQMFLERQGIHVVRYSNDDVIRDLDAVVEAVLHEAVGLGWQGAPSPSPSRGEGGKSR